MSFAVHKNYQSKDGRVKMEVRIEPENVWLSAEQMALLFQKPKSTIEKLIAELTEAGEIDPEKDELKPEDERLPGMTVSYWSLEAIIVVGNRLQSSQTKPFRQWAAKQIFEATEKSGTKSGWLGGILASGTLLSLIAIGSSFSKMMQLENGILLIGISVIIGIVSGILLAKKLKSKLAINRKQHARVGNVQFYIVMIVTGLVMFAGLQLNNALLEEENNQWYLVTEKSPETNSSDCSVTIEMNGKPKKLKCSSSFYSNIIVGGKILISIQKSKIGFDCLEIKLGQTKSGFVSN